VEIDKELSMAWIMKAIPDGQEVHAKVPEPKLGQNQMFTRVFLIV